MDQKFLGNIPWGGVAVVVMFLASVSYYTPRPFESMRPAQQEKAQELQVVPGLEIDARLWEDPFSAYKRHRVQAKEREALEAPADCEPAEKLGAVLSEPPGTCPLQKGISSKRKPVSSAMATRAASGAVAPRASRKTLLIGVLVPGESVVGAEEYRRRARYAVLSGLHAEGYVARDPGHMGSLTVNMQTGESPCGPATGDARTEARVVVPFEVLDARPWVSDRQDKRKENTQPYGKVAMLWLNEGALLGNRLDRLRCLVERVSPARAQAELPHDLVLIGPSSSDALADLLRGMKRKPRQLVDDPLAHARIFSPSATVSEQTLEKVVGDLQSAGGLPDYVRQHLAASAPGGASAAADFRRTIADEGLLIRSLARELGRRLPTCKKGRIVVFAERDSLYSQALMSELRAEFKQREGVLCNRSGMDDPGTIFQPVFFFRGIDGVTTDDAAAKSEASRRADKIATGPIEWPESRDQLDYLRRMATELKESESAFRVRRSPSGDTAAEGRERSRPILAFGVFGQDVHDKLLILQALRPRFQDRLMFTTDMDARFVHPDTEPFTRNLIVASSLPLEFPNPRLQSGTPPMRDVYQMAEFVSARLAVKPSFKGFDEAIEKPSIYEIGRSHAVPVDGYDLSKDHSDNPSQWNLRIVVSLALFCTLSCALFVWPGAPSMRKVRDTITGKGTGAAGEALSWPSALMAALELAAFTFMVASLGEYVRRTGAFSLATVIVAASTGLALLIALQWNRGAGRGRAGHIRSRIVLAIGACAVLGGIAWATWPPLASGYCADCEPVVGWSEGVSAWPSHLLHLVTLFLILWALDEGICGAQSLDAKDAAWLGMSLDALRRDAQEPVHKLKAPRRFSRFLHWRGRQGSSEPVHFSELWTHYSMAHHGPTLVISIVILWMASVSVLAVLYYVIGEGDVPEMPIRGTAHRQLISWTLYVVLMLWPLLVIMVTRTTLLACRFIRELDRRRTHYPPTVLSHFAAGLGALHQDLWMCRFAEDPRHRQCSRADEALHHSLMDDWIDVLLVERRTRWVARQVIMPFVILALILVASSRLFDAWPMDLPFVLTIAFFFLGLAALTLLLNQSAERLRAHALVRMCNDLVWMEGSGETYAPLVGPFKRLIEQVEGCRGGAFASFFDQPLLKAALVPLGSAGGARLLDQLLMGR